MEIISVVNQKGGVGKTFTAVNVAIGVARRMQDIRVLVLDLDPQGSLSISLGVENPDDETDTVSSALEKVRSGEDFDPKTGIRTHPEGIDFLPGNITLIDTETHLTTVISREYILGKYLHQLKDEYDVVILDCSPSLGLITVNALACSDQIIIPVQAQYLSVKGMEQLFRTVGEVKKINSKLEVAGVLVTMASTRTKNFRKTYQNILDQYTDKVNIFKTTIPHSTKAMETSEFGTSIFQHDPTGKVAEAYENLVKELLKTEEVEPNLDIYSEGTEGEES